ncbi:MAG: efflux RND transporter periplasmic adaptor subunit [Verrucomicrobiae bacterium]|nr:efflux RND transporter periplasmic adaptor subunit [Verrucomicrobiae bacterium]
MKKSIPSPGWLLAGAGLLALGWAIGAMTSGGSSHPPRGYLAGDAAAGTIWTCSMHHQIRRDKPGKCPLCAMDLVPASQLSGKDDPGPRALRITDEARALAGIRTVPVERRLVDAEIRLIGRIDYDETRKKTLAAWFPQRIDRLYVDYTGIPVQRGDHLARVYSPELLTAQKELLSALRFGSEVETIRDKLRLWGLSDEAIRAIEERGETSDRMEIDSPLEGVVIRKHINEGDYRRTGEPLFEIADLGHVWVQLEAYESDLPWLRYGQRVTFEAEAVPGRTFEGIVAFISPVLDPATRTVKVRVNAENPALQLRPGVFVHAVVHSTLAGVGKVVAPELRGKWISPMHPEIIADRPGDCPICGMKLVKAEELGYTVAGGAKGEKPLAIPASAVLLTGKRAVVYVETPDTELPTYEGREIVLGARAGDFYLVESGLKEGERIVAEGAFKIDSALQIVAKPSMMSPDAGGEESDTGAAFAPGEIDPAFQGQLSPVLDRYLEIHAALAGDDLAPARKAAAVLVEGLDATDMALLAEKPHEFWMGELIPMREAAAALSRSPDLDAARGEFHRLSDRLIAVARAFDPPSAKPLSVVHCPMAFQNRGADWLQNGAEIRNPYFGARMLKCGEVVPRPKPALPGTTEVHQHGNP